MGGMRGMCSRVQGSARCELQSKQCASQRSLPCVLLHVHLIEHNQLTRVETCK